MGSDVKIARALISVTDKTGVVDFARTLVDDFGVEIISTGGTARAIEDAGVPVTPIEEFTGYPGAKLSNSISISHAIHACFPKAFLSFNETFFIPSGLPIPPSPRKNLLSPV